jgi:hypothetical protein
MATQVVQLRHVQAPGEVSVQDCLRTDLLQLLAACIALNLRRAGHSAERAAQAKRVSGLAA